MLGHEGHEAIKAFCRNPKIVKTYYYKSLRFTATFEEDSILTDASIMVRKTNEGDLFFDTIENIRPVSPRKLDYRFLGISNLRSLLNIDTGKTQSLRFFNSDIEILREFQFDGCICNERFLPIDKARLGRGVKDSYLVELCCRTYNGLRFYFGDLEATRLSLELAERLEEIHQDNSLDDKRESQFHCLSEYLMCLA